MRAQCKSVGHEHGHETGYGHRHQEPTPSPVSERLCCHQSRRSARAKTYRALRAPRTHLPFLLPPTSCFLQKKLNKRRIKTNKPPVHHRRTHRLRFPQLVFAQTCLLSSSIFLSVTSNENCFDFPPVLLRWTNRNNDFLLPLLKCLYRFMRIFKAVSIIIVESAYSNGNDSLFIFGSNLIIWFFF